MCPFCTLYPSARWPKCITIWHSSVHNRFPVSTIWKFYFRFFMFHHKMLQRIFISINHSNNHSTKLKWNIFLKESTWDSNCQSFVILLHLISMDGKIFRFLHQYNVWKSTDKNLWFFESFFLFLFHKFSSSFQMGKIYWYQLQKHIAKSFFHNWPKFEKFSLFLVYNNIEIGKSFSACNYVISFAFL